jgi:DNA-binding NarL/FixJ family response regulator
VINVLLADDHPIFREGLKRVLAGAGDLAVTGEAGSGEETLEKTSLLGPDVVVLDMSMPGQGGLDTVRELKRRSPRVRILILTVHPEDHFAVSCLKHGADGYMVKDGTPQQVVAAIRKLHAGGKYLTPSLAEQLVGALREPDPMTPHLHALLSTRQLEVLRLLGSGLTPSRIASRLHLSVKTVSTHRTRILQKLQMSTTAELMRYAIERDLGSRGWTEAIEPI